MSKLDRISGMATCYEIDARRLDEILSTCAMSHENIEILSSVRNHITLAASLLRRLYKQEDNQ